MEMLRSIHGKMFIPKEVYEEIQAGQAEGYSFYTGIDRHLYPFEETGWIHLTSIAGEEEFRVFGEIPSKLGKGESSCLAIARHRNWLFLTDDLDARKQAKRLGVRISGSIGCLILAIEKGHCSPDKANDFLHHMIIEGYRSPISNLSDLFDPT
jgi:predicted nucleic acid-binding protein